MVEVPANGKPSPSTEYAHNVIDVETGKPVFVRITAFNKNGASIPKASTPPYVIPAGQLSPPQSASVKVINSTCATVYWKPPADDGGAAITDYIVELAIVDPTATNLPEPTLFTPEPSQMNIATSTSINTEKSKGFQKRQSTNPLESSGTNTTKDRPPAPIRADPKDTQVDVCGFVSTKKYTAFVYAMNPFGPSQPTRVSPPIFATSE
jgi:hypothetical protein